ncbi:MAG: hypothetical protein KBT02_05785 [Treponema sp.]|nr:hypothetical protein [Candidatus Treponema caballi]
METIVSKTSKTTTKEKVLTVILFVCAIALPILSAMEFNSGKMVNGIAEAAFILPVIVGIVLALNKKFKPAATLLVVTTYAFATILSLIVNEQGAILVYRNCTYFFLALAMGLTFSKNQKLTQRLSLSMNVVQTVFCFFLLAPTGYSPQSKVITLFIMSTVLYNLISQLFFAYARIIDSLMKTVSDQKSDLEAELQHVSRIVKGSSANLQAISNLTDSVSDIRELVTASVNSMANIDTKVRNIDSGADSALEDARSISSNITSLSESISNMTVSQAETQKSVSNMVSTIREVADSAQEEHRILDSLSITSEDGSRQLRSLLENIKVASESIQAIYGKLEAIDSIAVQTNLLAMNAAIEAAHAGTAGKGFAVVASEIRKLADNSAKNSKEITEQLQSITECITTVSQEGSKTDDSFKGIQNGIHNVVESFNMIINSTEVLASSSEQVLGTMKLLDDCSASIKKGESSITASQKRLIENQENLKAAVAELNRESSTVTAQNNTVLEALEKITAISEKGRQQAADLMTLSEDSLFS